MKKIHFKGYKAVLSLLLSGCLVAGTVFGFWPRTSNAQAAGAKIETSVSYLFETENWHFNALNTNELGSDGTAVAGWFTAKNGYGVTLKSGVPEKAEQTALCFKGQSHLASAKLKLQQQTDYTLSFSYYADGDLSGQNIFEKVGLFTTNVENANVAWQGNGFIEYLDTNSAASYTSENAVFSERKGSGKTLKGAAEKTWHTLNFTFNSKEFESVYLLLGFGFANVPVYITDFSVAQQETNGETLLKPGAWGFNYINTNLLGASGTAVEGWFTAENGYGVTAVQEAPNKTGQAALRFLGQSHLTYTKLSLQPNTQYTLSFHYYADGAVPNGSVFNKTGIFAADAENAGVSWGKNGYLVYLDANSAASYTSENAVFETRTPSGKTLKGAAEKTWQSLSLTFNTAEFNALYFVLAFNFEKTPVYVTDINLVQGGENTDGDLNNPVNWLFNGINTAAIGSSGTAVDSWFKLEDGYGITKVRNAPEKAGQEAMYLKGRGQLASVKLPTLQKNTEYTLSFNYYVNGTAQKSPFQKAGIFTTDVENSKLSWEPNGYLNYLDSNKNASFTSESALFSQKTLTGKTFDSPKTGSWQTLSLNFNSGNFKDLYFVLGFTYEDLGLWLTDLAVTVREVEKWDSSPRASKTIDFEKDCYIDSENRITQETTGGVNNSGCLHVAKRDDNESGVTFLNWKSIARDKNDIVFRTAVKPNTAYYVSVKLKFMNAQDTGKMFLYYDYYTNLLDLISFDSVSVGEWTTYKRMFVTGSEQNEIAFTFNATKQHPEFFVDDVVITEYEAPTWNSTPVKQKVVDFEQDCFIRSENRITQLENGGVNNSGCLYIPKRLSTEGSVTLLNWQSIDHNKDDTVFRTAVKPNTAYNVSVKLKVTQNMQTDSKLILFYDYYSKFQKHSQINYETIKTGEWLTYQCTFVTAADQTVIAFCLNAGKPHPEMYLDDLVITEVEKSHPAAQDKTVIDFEKENIFFEQGTRMGVEETTGPNGNTTKALHVREGDYSNSSTTFLNWNTVVDNSDDMFCVPVKPNTNYHFSAWIKVDNPKNVILASNGLRLYAVYNSADDALSSQLPIVYKAAKGSGWLKYEWDFLTGADQNFAQFAFNANTIHPSFWVDDVSFTEIPPGFVATTEKSYCEDFYNLVSANFKTSGTVASKTVVKIPVQPNLRHTFGVTLSGSGNLVLAFDENGTQPIQKIAANGQRTGFEFITGSAHCAVYLIFNSSGNLNYTDAYLFRTKAISLNYDMGQPENPNRTKTPEYFMEVSNGLAAAEFENSSSPETGEVLPVILWLIPAALIALALSAKATWRFLRRK